MSLGDIFGGGGAPQAETLEFGDLQAQGLFGQTEQQFDPFVQGGTAAFQQQAALSGAQGPEAQQQALAGVQASPGQQFLRQRGERALLRNAAATGDLGGGRTQQALQEQAIGFGAQDIDRQFSRLGQVAQPGFQAVSQLGQTRFGLGQQEQQFALGQQQVQLQNAQAQAAAQGQGLSNLLGVAGAAGGFFGGPLGAAIGSKLAGGLGGGASAPQASPSGDPFSSFNFAT